MSLRLIIVSVSAAVLVMTGLASLLLQDNLARFLMNPRIPYEAYTLPAPPDYAESSSWLTWPADDSEKFVDVFFVPDTAFRDAGHWNAPVNDTAMVTKLNRVILPNQAGPFSEIGDVFAPLYRQATLYAFFTQKHEGRESRKTAYADVKASFEYFLENTDGKRPLLLVGYGQGGLHTLGILTEFFQNNEQLRRRLLAAYVIDQSIPLDLFNYQLSATPPCKYPTDTRCVVSWSAYEEREEKEVWRVRNRALVWNEAMQLSSVEKRPLVCTNPLNWKLTTETVTSDQHLGAASATALQFGERPAIIEKAVSVRCDGGIAFVSKPKQRWLQRPTGFGKQWHPLNYNLFYKDIRVNLEQRLFQLLEQLEEENNQAPPMGEPVEIGTSPIRKVPN